MPSKFDLFLVPVVSLNYFNVVKSIVLLFSLFSCGSCFSSTPSNSMSSATHKVAHFGAGCFWAPAEQINSKTGILNTIVGYCGDDTQKENIPDYDKVCGGYTKLVEAIRVEYDPNIVTYEDLLQYFGEVNTAEIRNKRQYKGIIFTANLKEEEAASKFLSKDGQGYGVVAEVEPMSRTFYVAENYHQNYWTKWKIRIPSFFVALTALSYIGDNGYWPESFVSEQTASNIVCYGCILFLLLERRLDKSVREIIQEKE